MKENPSLTPRGSAIYSLKSEFAGEVNILDLVGDFESKLNVEHFSGSAISSLQYRQSKPSICFAPFQVSVIDGL